jgi:PAS domain S-box-containing protein
MYKQLRYWVKKDSRNKEILTMLLLGIVLVLTTVLYTTRNTPGMIVILYYAGGAFIILNAIILWSSVARTIRSKMIRTELLQKQDLLKTTLSSITEGVITIDDNANIVYMNPAAENISGWKYEEVKGRSLSRVYDVVNEETGKSFENVADRIFKSGKSIELENNTILRTKYGSNLIISNCGAPILDAGKNITGAVLVFNDITEKKIVEKRLIEREKQYRELIQHLPEAVYTCDELGYLQLYNKAAVKLWGREPVSGNEQWGGAWKMLDRHGKEIPLDSSPMAIAMKERRPVRGEQIIIQRPDGSLRHVIPYPTPLFDDMGKLTGAVNMLIDITEKREKELLAQRTEEKYRILIEQAADAVIIYSFDGTIHEFNPTAYKLTGYTRDEFGQLQLQDVLVDEVIINLHNVERMQAGETVLFERKIKTKNGSILDAEVNARILPDGRNLAFVRDITERKKTEKELKLSEERYRHLFNNNGASIYIWEVNTLRILEANTTACQQYGYSPEQFKELTILDMRPVEEHENIRDLAQKIKIDSSYNRDGIWKHIRKNGDEIFMDITSHSILYDDKTVRMVMGKDVTEKIVLKKQLERERFLRQREITNAVLSAQESERQHIGRELHDNINQILASSKLYLEMARTEEKGKEEYLKEADNLIFSAITEVRALSHSLIPPPISETALKEALDGITERITKTTNLRIKRKFAGFDENTISGKLKLAIYRIVQEQFNNILKHADAANVGLFIYQEGDKIVLRIKDDGVGFDPNIKTDGVGLMNIRARASLFSGKVKIISSPGTGCELAVNFIDH